MVGSGFASPTTGSIAGSFSGKYNATGSVFSVLNQNTFVFPDKDDAPYAVATDFGGLGDSPLIAARVANDGNENLCIELAVFIPSQADNDLEYTLIEGELLQVNGLLEAFVTQLPDFPSP
jgi:hypothetical protein